MSNTFGQINVDSQGKPRVSQLLPGGTDPFKVGEQVEEAEKTKADPIRDLVKFSNDKIDANAKHLDKLNKIKSEIASIRGNSIEGSSVFDKMEALVVDSSGKIAELVGVTIEGSLPRQVIDFNHTQKASADSSLATTDYNARDFALSASAMNGKSAALGWTGNLILGYEGEATTSIINVQAAWSLETLASQIDATPNFSSTTVLEEGTTNTYKLLIQAASAQGGKVLKINSSAVTGANNGELPEARLASVTESGGLAGTTSALLMPPSNTFDSTTDTISGHIEGKVKSVSVTGAGPYDISIDVENQFGSMIFSNSNFVVGTGTVLTLTDASSGATFSITTDATDVSGLSSATNIKLALEQMFGVGGADSDAPDLISPSAAFSNGLASGAMSASENAVPGLYSVKYDGVDTLTLSNGPTQWTANIAGPGAQTVTLNEITILLDGTFDNTTAINDIKFEVTENGMGKLKSFTESAGWYGTLTLGTKDGTKTQNITIKRDWSIDQIIRQIDNNSEESGVTARRIGDKRIELFSRDLSIPITVDVSQLNGYTTGNIATYAGGTEDSLVSKFVINGQTYSVKGNKFEITPGVFIESEHTDNYRLILDQSATEIATSITNTFTAINELFEFYEKQQTNPENLPKGLTEEEIAEYGTLRNQRILRTSRAEVFTALSKTVPGIDSIYSNLSSIGIKYDVNEGRFKIEDDKLAEAIANRTDDVDKIFRFKYTLSDTDFMLRRHEGWVDSLTPQSTTEASINSVKLTVNRDGSGIVTGEFMIDGLAYSAVLRESGDLMYFRTPEDAPIKDLELAYMTANIPHNSSKSVTMTATNGIAETLNEILDKLTDKTEGTLKTHDDQEKDKIKRYEAQIDRIEDAAKRSKEMIIQQLQRVSEAIYQLQQMDKFVEGMIDTMFNKDAA